MQKLLCLTVLLAAIAGFTQSASAQENLARFIEGFNGIEVKMQGGSAKCGIKDENRYATALEKKLKAIGLKADPVAIPTAYLAIWGTAFGPLKQQCAIFMSLRLGTAITAGALRVDAKLKNDQVLIERYKEVVGTFPAAFFFASTLFVKLTPSAPEAVEEALDALVGELKKART